MPEHVIQLRRGWEAEVDGQTLRVELPTVWGLARMPRLLCRRFQRPPLDSSRDQLYFRFEASLGIRSISFNGKELDRPKDSVGVGELPLIDLSLRRQCLVLELDPEAIDREAEWGRMALVIRSR